MRKVLLSTMLLAGMSLGFAKGTPVNQTNGTETTIASEKPIKVEKYHFDSKEELDKFLKEKCLLIIDIHQESVNVEEGDGYVTITIVTTDTHIEIEYDC